MATTKTSNKHLETLIRVGAAILNGAERIPVSEAWYRKALRSLRKDEAVNAVEYDFYPGFDCEIPFSLLLHRDGHIDTGSSENIERILYSL